MAGDADVGAHGVLFADNADAGTMNLGRMMIPLPPLRIVVRWMPFWEEVECSDLPYKKLFHGSSLISTIWCCFFDGMAGDVQKMTVMHIKLCLEFSSSLIGSRERDRIHIGRNQFYSK